MADKIIRVDMTTQTATVEDFPEKWRLLGGRALSARILLEECSPTCDPLGPDNVFVLAPGALAGTAAPTSAGVSVSLQRIDPSRRHSDPDPRHFRERSHDHGIEILRSPNKF